MGYQSRIKHDPYSFESISSHADRKKNATWTGPRESKRRRSSPSNNMMRFSFKRSANNASPTRNREVACDSNRSSFPVISTLATHSCRL